MSNSKDGPSSSQPQETLQNDAGTQTPLQTQVSAPSTVTPGPQEDRTELISRARSFLLSPQVQYQDIAAKRAFLAEKGLNDLEINELLRMLPPQLPSIPPRNYPQSPPSKLPVLLLALARLFSWLAGGSAVILLLYQRLLLPRIVQNNLARRSLKSHQLSLLRQLTTSLSSTKEAQSEALSILPRADPYKEPGNFARCGSVPDILKMIEELSEEPDFSQIPLITLLRCGLLDSVKGKESDVHPTTEELFRYLESQISWLLSEEGLDYENRLWETLSTCPLFAQYSSNPSPNASNQDATPSSLSTRWKYIPPTPPETPPLVKSLQALSSQLPKDWKSQKSPFQHTLQAMSDFTGYISTQVYLPYRLPQAGVGLSGDTNSPIEEELRKEIRALKGLVLNRRSFMPTLNRNFSSTYT